MNFLPIWDLESFAQMLRQLFGNTDMVVRSSNFTNATRKKTGQDRHLVSVPNLGSFLYKSNKWDGLKASEKMDVSIGIPTSNMAGKYSTHRCLNPAKLH